MLLRTGRHREVPKLELYHTAREDLNPALSPSNPPPELARVLTTHTSGLWQFCVSSRLPSRSALRPPQCPRQQPPAGACPSRTGRCGPSQPGARTIRLSATSLLLCPPLRLSWRGGWLVCDFAGMVTEVREGAGEHRGSAAVPGTTLSSPA